MSHYLYSQTLPGAWKAEHVYADFGNQERSPREREQSRRRRVITIIRAEIWRRDKLRAKLAAEVVSKEFEELVAAVSG